MPSVSSLRVMPASTAQASAARRLRLSATQTVYAGDVAANVDAALDAPDSEAIAVLLGATVIGFYRLDLPRTVARPPSGERRPAALRALALDLAWQRRGLGLATLHACFADLARRHPDRPQLALNVHVANTAARRLYARAGFVDSGRTLDGGQAAGGPLRLLRRTLGMGESRP